MAKQSSTDIKARWYHGGIASAMAACCTHPLDLIKVHMQTVAKGEKVGLVQMGVRVLRSDGIMGLYNGLSASVLRQLTYSMTRFAIYEGVKNNFLGKDMPFYQKVLLGGLAGFSGGLVGTPADLINVRMQNDMKIPFDQRRNYKHAVDGLYQVFRHEGPTKLMSGASMASTRAIFVTIGQLAMYDTYKQFLIKTGFFQDNIVTHFSASFFAGATATAITMPLDVMKTRMMNAPPGMYSSLLDCAKDIASIGPSGFFKGFLPAFIRLGPHTILTFIFFEQIRMQFGYRDQPKKED